MWIQKQQEMMEKAKDNADELARLFVEKEINTFYFAKLIQQNPLTPAIQGDDLLSAQKITEIDWLVGFNHFKKFQHTLKCTFSNTECPIAHALKLNKKGIESYLHYLAFHYNSDKTLAVADETELSKNPKAYIKYLLDLHEQIVKKAKQEQK